MRGNVGPLIFLLVLVALFGGVAWLTQHPDAEIVKRAESWPYVGPLATEFRQRYVPPPAPPIEEDPELVEYVEPTIPPVGEGYVWVLPGTVMRREPSASSPKILQFDLIANVTRLEKRGDWFRIWRRGRVGWVFLEGYDDENPPYGSDPDPVLPLPSAAPAAEALVSARGFLKGGGRELELGPYRLWTDSDDDSLLEYLGRLADGVSRSYVERYGRRPLGAETLEVVVLYKDEASYRRLQGLSDELLGLDAGGHAASGLAVLFVGGREREEVAETLVHELVHTLNRRAIGPALPTWLDEGLADDLASSPFGADGTIVLGALGGHRRQEGNRVQVSGGVAALWKLRDALRGSGLIHVRELLHLDWNDFVRSRSSELHYAASAFWIRFLLDAEDGALAGTLRDYLAAISEGEPATPEGLRKRLDMSWNQLNARFQLWIEFQDTPTSLASPNPF